MVTTKRFAIEKGSFAWQWGHTESDGHFTKSIDERIVISQVADEEA